MILAANFFSLNDLFLVPLCLIVLYAIIRNRAERYQDKQMRRLYYKGFYFKVFCVFSYTFVTEIFFKGGDTGLYYQGVKDLRYAVDDNFDNLWVTATSLKLDIENPLTPYFYYDNYANDFTYNYMLSPSNFFVPRLGLIPSFLFLNSYLCISLCFGFFALGGAIRIFKFFRYYYPSATREIALAAIFLPSVGFWSAGLLKDPICFGSVGFILYAVFNIFIRKTNYKSSFLIILACSFLLYQIKVYILLVLILAIVIWLFAETNKVIEEKVLRNIFSGFTLIMSVVVGYFLVNYLTSQEALQTYKLDTLLEVTEQQRKVIESVSVSGSSTFKINTSSIVGLIFNSIVATFFRPFIWEINTPIAIFSAVESAFFLFLTLNFFFKRGFFNLFKFSFSDPRLLVCFVFSFVLGMTVGASTNNFGSLSRYKIPCMPFYFIMLLLLYRKTNLSFPNWFNRLLNKFN